MARVHAQGELRRYFDGQKTVDVEAETIRELVTALEERFSQVKAARLTDMAVAIDGEVMSNAEFERIGPDSDVHFLTPFSGG